MEAYLVFLPNLLLPTRRLRLRAAGWGTEPRRAALPPVGYETTRNLGPITSCRREELRGDPEGSQPLVSCWKSL